MTSRRIDREEARLIADILETGSRFYKEADVYKDRPAEGTFLHYDPASDRFIARRYESGDSELHNYGFDETLVLTKPDLLRLLTGAWVPSSTWYHIAESDSYRFDFDDPQRTIRIRSQFIRDRMDIRHYPYLRCDVCGSQRVAPRSYACQTNPGSAHRFTHLEVTCLDCGRDSSYDIDD